MLYWVLSKGFRSHWDNLLCLEGTPPKMGLILEFKYVFLTLKMNSCTACTVLLHCRKRKYRSSSRGITTLFKIISTKYPRRTTQTSGIHSNCIWIWGLQITKTSKYLFCWVWEIALSYSKTDCFLVRSIVYCLPMWFVLKQISRCSSHW